MYQVWHTTRATSNKRETSTRVTDPSRYIDTTVRTCRQGTTLQLAGGGLRHSKSERSHYTCRVRRAFDREMQLTKVKRTCPGCVWYSARGPFNQMEQTANVLQ